MDEQTRPNPSIPAAAFDPESVFMRGTSRSLTKERVISSNPHEYSVDASLRDTTSLFLSIPSFVFFLSGTGFDACKWEAHSFSSGLYVFVTSYFSRRTTCCRATIYSEPSHSGPALLGPADRRSLGVAAAAASRPGSQRGVRRHRVLLGPGGSGDVELKRAALIQLLFF